MACRKTMLKKSSAGRKARGLITPPCKGKGSRLIDITLSGEDNIYDIHTSKSELKRPLGQDFNKDGWKLSTHSHLILSQVVLGAEAKPGEINFIELQITKPDKTRSRSPLAMLSSDTTLMMELCIHYDVALDSTFSLMLTSGSGPVTILVERIVRMYQDEKEYPYITKPGELGPANTSPRRKFQGDEGHQTSGKRLKTGVTSCADVGREEGNRKVVEQPRAKGDGATEQSRKYDCLKKDFLEMLQEELEEVETVIDLVKNHPCRVLGLRAKRRRAVNS